MLLALKILAGLIALLLAVWLGLAWVTLRRLRRASGGGEPAEATVFDHPEVAEAARWAAANGFERTVGYRFGKTLTASWRDADSRHALTASTLPFDTVFDFSCSFDHDAAHSLTTRNGRQYLALPPAPGQWVQWFPKLTDLETLWRRHRRGARDLAEAHGLRPVHDPRPSDEQLTTAVDRLREQARATPLVELLRWWSRARDTAGRTVAEQLGLPAASPDPTPSLATVDPERWKAQVQGQRARRGLLMILAVAVSILWFNKPWRRSTAGEPPLSFLVYHLGGASADDELPLVVALHGFGGTPESFVGAYRGLDSRVRLVVPAGIHRYYIGRIWYALENATPETDIAAAVSRLAAFLAQLQDAWPTRGKPILTGFSQGGILSFQLAVDHPEALGAVLPVAGGLIHPPADGVELPAAPPIRAFHGGADTKVDAGWAESSVAGLREHGADAALTTFEGVGHTITGELRQAYHRALRDAIEAAR